MALTWLAAVLFLALTATVAGQDRNLSLEDQRQVEALTEQIRMLHSEQRYNEVIQTANRLLTIDPSNAAGVIWRDRAQLRLQGPPPRPERLIQLREPPERQRGMPIVDVASIDAGDFTPVPLQPRTTRTSVIASPGSLPPWLMWAVIALVVAVLLIAILLVLRMRASQKQVETRVADVVTRQAETAHGYGGVHDEVTRGPTAVHDEDSVMQFGEVGRDFQATEEDTGPPPAAPPKKQQKAETIEDEQTFVELEEFGADDEEESISLDFGGGDDVSKKEDTGFNSLMFDDVEETSAPSDGPADTDEQTFNSMMFGGDDETKMPGSPPPDMPTETEEQTFNSMMFGGEETGLNEPKEDVSLGDTVDLAPGLDDDPEETNILGSSQTGAERFEHQKSAGIQALEGGDYKLAVQALTLAQALKPDDSEVNDKLAEAKKLRDQG